MPKKYGFYSLCLIPFLTLMLSLGFGLTDTNFSVIGNSGGRRLAFLLWGAVAGNYFYLYTEELLELAGCQDRMLQRFLFVSLIFFITAVGIPYIPEQVPRLSRLHVHISFLAPLFLGLAQVRFLCLLQRKTVGGFLAQWLILAVLAAGSAILFFSIGIVSTVLELFLTLGVCLYLWLLHRKLIKKYSIYKPQGLMLY